jgi:hypothetical protein
MVRRLRAKVFEEGCLLMLEMDIKLTDYEKLRSVKVNLDSPPRLWIF